MIVYGSYVDIGQANVNMEMAQYLVRFSNIPQSKAWFAPPGKFTIALSSHIKSLIGGFTTDCKIPTWLFVHMAKNVTLTFDNKSQHYFLPMLS